MKTFSDWWSSLLPNKSGSDKVEAASWTLLYWLTPLARNPPSTTRISPVTNADASLAR